MRTTRRTRRSQRAGIAVQWSNPKFYVTHEKSIVVDEKAALVATFNLCTNTSRSPATTASSPTIPVHVRQIVEVFNADWEHLDWDARPMRACCGAIRIRDITWRNSSTRPPTRLDIQHPKYVDAVILDRIAAAADRGVKVHVLCGGKHGISEWDILDTFASLRTLRRFGVKVHKQKNLRVHAKLLIVDDSARAGRLDEHRPQRVRSASRAGHHHQTTPPSSAG